MNHLDLQRKLHDKAFKPFRIRLVNNTTYDIVEPWMIIAGETSAVIVTRAQKDNRGYQIAEDWRTVSIDHMLEFQDIEVKSQKRRPA